MDDLQKKTCMAIVNVFESGSVAGNYGSVTVLPGDSGHLTYGRSQTTLGSGHLFTLLEEYCNAHGAIHATDLRPFLHRVAAKDFTLDTDAGFKAILRDAGQDPIMQQEQDDFFEQNFFLPAIAAAEAARLVQPLSQTVVYDSHIQGGWNLLSKRVNSVLGPVSDKVTEQIWIAKYVAVRSAFLSAGKPPLPKTVYRMQAFNSLVDSANWQMTLPLTVHGVTISDSSFAVVALPPVIRVAVGSPELDRHPVLMPQIPYAKGVEVLALQQLLNAQGLHNSEDQIYGPFTQALVKRFQQQHGLRSDAVTSPQTWEMLGADSTAGV